MPNRGPKRCSFLLDAPASRFILLLVALVFLMNAADPTPRFLGIKRGKWIAEKARDRAEAHHVLPVFSLPPALKPTPEDGPSVHGRDLAGLDTPAVDVAVTLLPRPSGLAFVPAAALAPAPGRTGATSPLRC